MVGTVHGDKKLEEKFISGLLLVSGLLYSCLTYQIDNVETILMDFCSCDGVKKAYKSTFEAV